MRRIKRDIVINVLRYSCKVPVILDILMKFEFSQQIFEKSLNIKFYENPSSGSGIVPCGQTDEERDRVEDKETNMTGAIVVFCSFSNSSKNYYFPDTGF
jgi:hypothetical protein